MPAPCSDRGNCQSERRVLTGATGSKEDKADKERLAQTHPEQVDANVHFRALAEFFAATTYLHLVPQLLKFADRIGGNRLDADPFGQNFLERLAQTPANTRNARLKKIR